MDRILIKKDPVEQRERVKARYVEKWLTTGKATPAKMSVSRSRGLDQVRESELRGR